MQEPENPWTHWEAAFTLGGRALLDDTRAAHRGADTIAGVPVEIVEQTNPDGRVVRETLADGSQVGFSYDGNSNLTTVTPPGRPAHTFDYTSTDLPQDYNEYIVTTSSGSEERSAAKSSTLVASSG